MNTVLTSLRAFFKRDKPLGIRHAAVKTTIDIANQNHETVIRDMINLLEDPQKIMREEAKRGVETLAGNKYCFHFSFIITYNITLALFTVGSPT